MRPAAAIFDLDGTVLLSEEAYEEAFKKVLSDNGVKNPPKHPQISGIGVQENWEILKEKHSLTPSAEQLTQDSQDEYLARLGQVRVREGFLKLVKDFKDSGVLVALATSNAWWLVKRELEHFKIEQYFDSITTGEEVDETKPQPDIFLKTAQKLGVEPGQCLVFEDAPSGVEAAKNAGMKVVALTSTYASKEDLKGADVVVSSLEEITPTLLSEL